MAVSGANLSGEAHVLAGQIASYGFGRQINTEKRSISNQEY